MGGKGKVARLCIKGTKDNKSLFIGLYQNKTSFGVVSLPTKGGSDEGIGDNPREDPINPHARTPNSLCH